MANSVIGIQFSIPSGVKSPVVTGNKRLTLHNLINLLAGGLNAGKLGGLSGAAGFIQVQTSLVPASATCTPAAVAGADTVSIGGQALTATQRRASGTVTCASVTAADTVTVAGVVFTAVNGAVTPGEPTFDCSGTDTADATSLKTQFNAYSNVALTGRLAAKSSGAVVTFYAVTQGTWANSVTLASSNGTRLAVSGATLANGAAITNNTFDFAGSDITTGQALAAAINASTTAAVQRVVATVNNSTGVVTVTAKEAGDAGETITFTSSNGTRLAVTGSGFLASGSSSAVTRWSL